MKCNPFLAGIGAGLYDRLKELMGDLVEGLNFSSKAFDHQHFVNRRAEIWDAMRQWLLDPVEVSIPDSDELQGDLCAPSSPGTIPGGTRFDSSGRLILESKDRVKSRLSFSPDLADAAALTFAVDLNRVQEVDWDELVRAGKSWLSG